MCGISGTMSVRAGARPDVDRLRALNAKLAHRGPDGEGVFVSADGRAALGHRRLSVIDLATGQQPMCSPDGRYALVFNGEIYNYKELRSDLAARGVQFRTHADTEVLLHLLIRDGAACVHALRGMFAFAFWDQQAHRGLLARDRFGKKPLYYLTRDDCVWFASSLSALRDSIPGPWEHDVDAIDAYLTLGYIPAPATVYRDVHKLEAGTLVHVEGSALRTERYWDMSHAAPPFCGSFEEAVDAVDATLREAVRLRLRSDVPLGVFLSGGVDSSLVAALAQQESSTPVETFAIAFAHEDFDESVYAAGVAEHLGTMHRRFDVKADVLELLPSLAWHYGEPFADSSAIPTWILSEHTRRHVTVALGGDGGDEAFAGYQWYGTARQLTDLARRVPGLMAGAVGAIAQLAHASTGLSAAGRLGRALRMLAIRPESRRFAALRSFVGEGEGDQLLGGALLDRRRAHGAIQIERLAAMYDATTGSPLRRMRVVDIRTYLADCLLPKVDVASMAHSLEARAPLLDHEVVTLGLSLPDEYVASPNGGKRVLRALLSRHVPSRFFERRKQGFSLPLAPWFRGVLRPRVDLLLRNSALLDSGWLNAAGLRAMLAEHQQEHRDHSQRIYSLLMLDEWLRQS